ncbi:MAG: DUF3943 domain-containing protein [Paramuribaculum sp.]|nr:DUF3943 domain-containing protein [Paramuribaculum sp.]
MNTFFKYILALSATIVPYTLNALTANQKSLAPPTVMEENITSALSDSLSASDTLIASDATDRQPTLYDYPYSRTRSIPNWNRLWVNTSVLVAGGVATMAILESLPQESTAWNKTEDAKVSMWKRWVRNVCDGPVWDGDNLIFNYVLHPYAGAAYYMSARGCGFNCWGSFLYCFAISTLFWEYGFEAFNEIPSVQDLIITPVVGSLVGEGFYILKRRIVDNGYRLFGSRVLGYVAAFFLDPVNEVIGYFRGDQKKFYNRDGRTLSSKPHLAGGINIMPQKGGVNVNFSLTYNF